MNLSEPLKLKPKITEIKPKLKIKTKIIETKPKLKLKPKITEVRPELELELELNPKIKIKLKPKTKLLLKSIPHGINPSESTNTNTFTCPPWIDHTKEINAQSRHPTESSSCSLTALSCEIVRKYWSNYKNVIAVPSPIYTLLWDDLLNKVKLKKDAIVEVLIKFIDNESFNYKKPTKKEPILPKELDISIDQLHFIKENATTLLIRGLNGVERLKLHKLCDQLGLFHESKQTHKRNKKIFCVYRPDDWSWEFTRRNPYSLDDSIYRQRELEHQEKEKRTERYHCCSCDASASDTQLYCSVYIRGLYCDDCLEIETDDDGNPFSDHKFEPFEIPYV